MVDPNRRHAPLPARLPPLIWAALLLALPEILPAFVTLDTSAAPAAADSSAAAGTRPPEPDTLAPDSAAAEAGRPLAPAGPSAAAALSGPSSPARPHFRNALFLSADNMLVYAYLGVFKAFEEFDLGVDLLIVESKAAAVGAAWSLGYPAAEVEARFLEHPLPDYMRPHREYGSLASRFTPYGPDPIQVEIPLGIASLQAPTLNWTRGPTREGDEYLHLSWMIAKLTHDAPGGPVEDLKDTPRPMAVQVADLSEEKGKVLLEGNLQSLLKGALLPKEALHRRKRLWSHASGAMISGHTLMAGELPFTFDRLVLVEPGRHVRPPALEEAPEPWQDSLDARLKARPSERSAGNQGVLRIELNPDADFDRAGRDPKAWIDLGYTSALRSMDVLITTLGRRERADSASARAAGPDRVKARALPPPLGLNRLTVNPLASGGRQLLQDLVRKSVSERDDSTGDGPISDLIHSGFYSDLDVEWAASRGEEHPILVFDALERSRLLFRAAANVSNTGEALPDRGPELYAGLAWSEPFYVPFRAEGAVLLGGHRPGFAGRAMVAPIHPVRLELGAGWREWRIRYPEPPGNVLGLSPWSFRLARARAEIFLNLFPLPGARLSTAIQKHEMGFPAQVASDGQLDPGTNVFESTDFQQTGFLGLGLPGPTGIFGNSLWLRYRNLNRVNLVGPVKRSTSSLESRLRASIGDFRFLDQYYWSDKDRASAGLFDFMEAGEAAAFSFQDEYFLAGLRSAHFQNVQAEYAPVFGKAGMRLLAGGFRMYGSPLAEGFGRDFTRIYWEAQASYATAAGPLRAGMAGMEGEAPVYFVRFGADLDLDPDGPER